MSQAMRKRLTFEQFLAWESRQEFKHEFVDGEPVAMAGASVGHNLIQTNLISATVPKLRGTGCRTFTSDLLVRTGNDRGRYPDTTIDCGQLQPGDRVASEPRVVFEILSPETQRHDRTIKLADYNATPSIAHYVLIEQSVLLVHVYSRGPHGDFNLRPQEIRGLGGVVELPSVGISLTMAEIYDGLEVSPPPDEPELAVR